MSKPIVRIHNSQTNEIIDREMTDAEYADWQAQCADWEKLKTEKAQADADKAALLAKLGITADEAKLLLGGN
jgi:hypothetical protein